MSDELVPRRQLRGNLSLRDDLSLRTPHVSVFHDDGSFPLFTNASPAYASTSACCFGLRLQRNHNHTCLSGPGFTSFKKFSSFSRLRSCSKSAGWPDAKREGERTVRRDSAGIDLHCLYIFALRLCVFALCFAQDFQSVCICAVFLYCVYLHGDLYCVYICTRQLQTSGLSLLLQVILSISDSL